MAGLNASYLGHKITSAEFHIVKATPHQAKVER